MVHIAKLSLGGMQKPMGTTGMPVVSWIIGGSRRNVRQTAFRLQLSERQDFSDLLADISRSSSKQAVRLSEATIRLRSRTKYYVRVRIWDNYGRESGWSKTVEFVTALLENEWKGEFISPENEDSRQSSAGYYLRKNFMVERKVRRAYVCATALGVYEFYLNGRKVSGDVLAPGWTSYHKHLLYQTYDITDYLKQGRNMAGVLLGAGWYKGTMGFLGRRNNYGTKTAFLGELYIEYENGESDLIYTDQSWECADSPILFSEIYDGETYDAGMEIPFWNEPDGNEGTWREARKMFFDKKALKPQPGCRIKVMERIPAVSVFQTPRGETVVDFGQNMAGWAEFTVYGKQGDVVAFRCFEVLDKAGNVYTENLRKAKQKIWYRYGRDGQVIFRPHFTFQGFRYLYVEDYPRDVRVQDFTACAVYSDMEQTGEFQCSNPDLNQLHHNILWGMKSNFLDVPTDCPQRNERVGWTGDAQIFCRTSCFLMNTDNFWKKWLKDLAADQNEDGGVPHVVPDIISGYEENDWLLSQGTHSAAAWADAAVINPWTLYLVYGDDEVLRQQYDSMKKWISFMERHSDGYIWNYRLQFGDWVALDAEDGSYFGATPNELTCTAYFAYSVGLMSKAADALKNSEDGEYYRVLYKKIVERYREKFFDSSGHLTAQTQTAQIISLYFNLVPQEYRQIVVQDLLELLKANGGHLTTGFVGTPYICHVLSENGHVKEAYDLLLKDDFPSWLYQIRMGATTIWEHWDGIRPDGSMWSPDMNSFNHYAYGAVGDWMYRRVMGIDTSGVKPGYRHILICPHIGGGLKYVSGSYDSVRGRIAVRWEVTEVNVRLDIEIPVNAEASVILYDTERVIEADGVEFNEKDGNLIGTTGSGKYCFVYVLRRF